MKIRWLTLAAQDLEQAGAYIAQENPTSSVQVVLRIIKAAELLVDQPSIGRPGRIEGTRELVIKGTPFIVPYRQKKCLYRNSSGLSPVKMLARHVVITETRSLRLTF